MKSDLFMHEVKQTSSVFGRKSDVKVVFHGTAAMTDGEQIVLPELARGVDVSEETAAIMRGYTDHEAGHIRHSDMKLMRRTYEQWVKEGKHLLRSLHNAIEDVWLEKRVRAEYPGAEQNLRATTTAVNQDFLDRVRTGEISKADAADLKVVGPVAITWAGRKTYGGETCEQCLAGLDAKDRALVEKWASEVNGCKSSKDTIKLAEKVYAELKAKEEAPPPMEVPMPEKGKGKPEKGTKGEKGEKGERGESTGEGSDGDPVDGSGDEERSEGGASGSSSDGDDEGDGGSAPAPGTGLDSSAGVSEDGTTKMGLSAERPYEDFDLKSVVDRTLKHAGLTGEEATAGKYLPFSTKADKWHHRKLETDYSRTLREKVAGPYDSALERMQGEVNAIRRKLERALVSKQQRDWVGGREVGRLDAKRFAAVMAGKLNVFKERTDRAEIDTALTVLVDLSGSMGRGSKAYVARDCVMAIAEAVDRTGVAYEVVGFDNRRTLPRGWQDQIDTALRSGTKLARWEPLDMTIFKAFEDRLFEAKGGIYAIPEFVGGENTDGEAVLMAYSRLKARPERRKVLLTLSDGAPACRTADHTALQQHLRTAIETLRKDGCACLGVGIEDATVRHYYPEYVVVNSLEDLAGEAIGLLSKQLLGERVNLDRSDLMDVAS